MLKIKRITSFFCLSAFVVLCLPYLTAQASASSFMSKCPDTESSIFNKANDFYKESKYKEAIAEYKKIENMGFESGNLFFNLGNCYFKIGRFGEAILYYEKAKRLLPRDSDLKLNYALAKSEVSGYSVLINQTIFSRANDFLFQWFTIDELAIFLSICFMMCLGIFLAGYLRLKAYSFLKPVLFLLFVIFMIGCFSLTDRINMISREAVVLLPNAKIRFEPFNNADVFFELSQGAKVEVLQQKEDWAKIKRSDGKIGWMAKESFGFI